jgi:hypothetical protein
MQCQNLEMKLGDVRLILSLEDVNLGRYRDRKLPQRAQSYFGWSGYSIGPLRRLTLYGRTAKITSKTLC